jgi:predicted 3-demethylubiquinone-9 3-methyltransferase (glyoxalase superfamily)
MARTIVANKAISQRIVPCLWFDREAEEAARLYASTFKNSKVGAITRYTAAGYEAHHMPEGTVMTAEFTVEGHRFVALN